MVVRKTVISLLMFAIAVGVILFQGGCKRWQSVPKNNDTIPQITISPGLSSIYMLNEAVGWALGKNSILRTVDGGQTWADVTPPGRRDTDRSIVGEFLDTDYAWVAAVNNSEPMLTVYRTTDAGQTWRGVEVIRKTEGGLIYGVSLSFNDRHIGWMMVEPEHGMSSRPGVLYQTTDNGEHWSLVAKTAATGPSSERSLPFSGPIRFRNALTGWIGGRQGAAFDPDHPLYLTRDGGHSWEPQALPLPPGPANGKLDIGSPPEFFPPGGLNGVLPVVFVPASHKTVEYAMVPYITRDGGQTWRAGKPLQAQGLMDFTSASDGWAWIPEPRDLGSNAPLKGYLYHTADGGQTWEAIGPDHVLQSFLQKGDDIVELNFVTKSYGWLLLREPDATRSLNQGITRLLKTVDGGHTWTFINSHLKSQGS